MLNIERILYVIQLSDRVYNVTLIPGLDIFSEVQPKGIYDQSLDCTGSCKSNYHTTKTAPYTPCSILK